ncbi:alpha/beta fold hydrolase [uncultured Kordia sp.]|uniref:thioesterase II family protein n=1 Tax=uncultured Kordia sp. TaxID=507699 RepID=UPI00261FA073|nr:alpha/beta fold hydrolase [uncultured Kordia sp.]
MIYQKPQIFMLHFAGGNSYSFVFLKEKISQTFEVHTLELPGRGKRFKEQLLTNSQEAIDDYVQQIRAKRNGKPFIIYGHSMGATLGLFVAKKLEKIIDMPEALVLTGSVGIGVKDEEEEKRGKRYLMNEEDFKQELRELGGVPEEVLENEELFSFFSPQMRADFKVIEEGLPTENFAIQAPIYAIMGTEEKCSDRLDNWKRFTASYCNCELWEGNHFFINDHSEALVRILEKSFD